MYTYTWVKIPSLKNGCQPQQAPKIENSILPE